MPSLLAYVRHNPDFVVKRLVVMGASKCRIMACFHGSDGAMHGRSLPYGVPRHPGGSGEPSGSRWRGCAVTCRGHKGPRGGCLKGVAVLGMGSPPMRGSSRVSAPRRRYEKIIRRCSSGETCASQGARRSEYQRGGAPYGPPLHHLWSGMDCFAHTMKQLLNDLTDQRMLT